MLQKLPINGFEQLEDISELDKSFRKSCNEESNKGYFFEVEKLHDLHNDLLFLPERMQIEKV